MHPPANYWTYAQSVHNIFNSVNHNAFVPFNVGLLISYYDGERGLKTFDMLLEEASLVYNIHPPNSQTTHKHESTRQGGSHHRDILELIHTQVFLEIQLTFNFIKWRDQEDSNL